MSLVFAGITPHPPLSIPGIGKNKTELVKKTMTALHTLEQLLYVSHPDVILIISPHAGIHDQAFVINPHETFLSDFEAFGDLETSAHWRGSPALSATIARCAADSGFEVRQLSEETLDHGSSIPLFHLTAQLPHVSILPVGYSNLSPAAHVEFGMLLKDVLLQSPKRIAVVASGDMSHTLSKEAPAGYNTAGETFDLTLKTALTDGNSDAILGMDPELVADAQQCLYRSVLILLGIIKNMHYRLEVLCYEAPLGVGYLTGCVHLETYLPAKP